MLPTQTNGKIPQVRAITVSTQSLGSKLMHKGQNMSPCMLPEVENALDGQTASQPATDEHDKGGGKKAPLPLGFETSRPVLVDSPGSRADPGADQRL